MADDRELGLRLGAGAVIALLVLVPFGLLGALVMGRWAPLHELDAAVTDAVYAFALAHPVWVDAMAVVSWVFGPLPLRVAALVLVIWLIRAHRARQLALWVVITMTAGGLLSALLKLLVGRHRPELLEPLARATGFAFPSGHATNAALTAGVFLLVLLPFTRDRPVRRALLWAAAVVMALVTGLSRIVLGVHWASDVVAGWLLGAGVVAAVTVAFQAGRTHRGPALVEGVELGGRLPGSAP